MRTVKTKKELEKAIKDGETEIYVDSADLCAACMLAAKYKSIPAILAHIGVKSALDLASISVSAIVVEPIVITGGQVVVITIAICITAIFIIGILKDKKVDFEYKNKKLSGGTLRVH